MTANKELADRLWKDAMRIYRDDTLMGAVWDGAVESAFKLYVAEQIKPWREAIEKLSDILRGSKYSPPGIPIMLLDDGTRIGLGQQISELIQPLLSKQ